MEYSSSSLASILANLISQESVMRNLVADFFITFLIFTYMNTFIQIDASVVPDIQSFFIENDLLER